MYLDRKMRQQIAKELVGDWLLSEEFKKNIVDRIRENSYNVERVVKNLVDELWFYLVVSKNDLWHPFEGLLLNLREDIADEFRDYLETNHMDEEYAKSIGY
jgi:hypothetical protein